MPLTYYIGGKETCLVGEGEIGKEGIYLIGRGEICLIVSVV